MSLEEEQNRMEREKNVSVEGSGAKAEIGASAPMADGMVVDEGEDENEMLARAIAMSMEQQNNNQSK